MRAGRQCATLLLATAVGCGAAGRPPAAARFAERRLPSGGQGPFGVVVADLDGDGWPDLAVTDAGSDTVTILRATADGFAPPLAIPVGKVPRGLAAADLDGDRRLDLAIANALSHTVSVLLADGAGGFRGAEYPAGLAPFAVAVADLDGDGSPDLAVADETNSGHGERRGEITVLRNDRTGRFTSSATLASGTYPADVQSADLDGDGRVDLAAINWGSHDLALFLGRGDGTFAPGIAIPTGGSPGYTLAVARLDGDGRPELVTADVSGAVRVFANQGGGVFSPGATLTAEAGTRCVTVADLNRDGVADLATANTAANTVSVFFGMQGHRFAAPRSIPVGTQPRTLVAADVNRDGRIDLVVANGGSNDVSLLLGVP